MTNPRRSLFVAALLTLCGMLAYCFTIGGCRVPWWVLTAGLPFFGFAIHVGRPGRGSDPGLRSRAPHYVVLAIAAFFFAFESYFAGVAPVYDLEEYGTASRTDCDDMGTKEGVVVLRCDRSDDRY